MFLLKNTAKVIPNFICCTTYSRFFLNFFVTCPFAKEEKLKRTGIPILYKELRNLLGIRNRNAYEAYPFIGIPCPVLKQQSHL